MGESVICLERDCRYFLEHYAVTKYKGGYIPNMEMVTDKYCTHPTCRPQTQNFEVVQGRKIQQIRVCPLNQ